MSYNLIGNLGGAMDIQSLGLWNNLATQGYLGLPYNAMSNLTFSNMLSGILEKISANGLNNLNTVNLQTIDTNSLLKQELDKLGLRIALVPQELSGKAETDGEGGQNITSNYQKWKANYDTVRSGKSNTAKAQVNQRRITRQSGHSCSLQHCVFEKRS